MRLFKNISYTLASNLLSTLTSIFVVLIIPRFIGVRAYGMWQVFMFYAGYVGVMHLGWADGLFLRRGGQHIKDIDSIDLKSESLLYILFNTLIGLLVSAYGFFVSSEYVFIVISLGVGVVVINFRTWVTMILQSTGNFKAFSINLTAQSFIYLVLLTFIIVLHVHDYRMMITSYLVSQFCTSISGVLQIKNYIFIKGFNFKAARIEAKKNLIAGSKLMFANFTALLIVGIIRFGIQQKWSVETFGKVSLVLTISNFMMVFINAISLVLFPSLRRTSQKIIPLYSNIRNILMPVLFAMMAIYFPVRLLLPIWLPKYASVVSFFAVLMPMMVYQGKFEILSNTFMKNLRMEADLLRINLITLGLSCFLAYLTIDFLHNLNWAVVSIALVLAFRSIYSEINFRIKNDMAFDYEIVFETVWVIGFMIMAWNFSVMGTLIIYSLSLIAYIYNEREKIILGWKELKNLSKY